MEDGRVGFSGPGRYPAPVDFVYGDVFALEVCWCAGARSLRRLEWWREGCLRRHVTTWKIECRDSGLESVSSWDGSALLVVVLEMLCEEPVWAGFMRCKTCFAFFGLADLGNDAVATCLVVLRSWLGTAVSLDMAALHAAVGESV